MNIQQMPMWAVLRLRGHIKNLRASAKTFPQPAAVLLLDAARYIESGIEDLSPNEKEKQ